MKGRPIDQLVYNTMFPRPKPNDPRNFQQLLAHSLVPEVRLETQAFYGSLCTQEAKYPGLDYSHPPHRLRLSRFTWHRRLFRAFDHLRLTSCEIASLTKWEGTRWAKERYEKEQRVVIRDTTGDCIFDFVEPEMRAVVQISLRQQEAARAAAESMSELRGEVRITPEQAEAEAEDEYSDEEIESVGVELNERLRAAVAQREAGNTGTVMDEEWEQWLKEAVEAGGLPFTQPPNGLWPRPVLDTAALHPRLLNAARSGQWHQIPDFLHGTVRRHIEGRQRSENMTVPVARTHSSTPSSMRPATAVASRSLRAFSGTEPAPFSSLGHRQLRPLAEVLRRTMPNASVANIAASAPAARRSAMDTARG